MKLRLPVRLLAAVVAAVSHVTFLTVASASGAWAVEENDDMLFTDSSFVADGWSSSARQMTDATLSDKEAEALGQAEDAMPEEVVEAMDSLKVTIPQTEEKVAAEVSAAPEVVIVGGANTTQNVTSELLQPQEDSLAAEYNALMAGNTGTETPAVTLAAENTTAAQMNAMNDTVPETTVNSYKATSGAPLRFLTLSRLLSPLCPQHPPRRP